jgi:hypothetical protein
MAKIVHQETSLLRSRQHARNLDMTTGFDSIQQKQLIMPSWSPPPIASLKCNLDVTTFQQHNHLGFDFCLFDRAGLLFLARTDSCYADMKALFFIAVDWVSLTMLNSMRLRPKDN